MRESIGSEGARGAVSVVCTDRLAASIEVAHYLVDEIKCLAERAKREPLSKQRIVIALCGGTSPKAVFPKLIDLLSELSPTTLARLAFVLIDERRAPLDSPDSNFRLLSAELFSPLVSRGLLELAQIFPFGVELSPEIACQRYTETIQSLGGIDIGLLGVGPDSHVAALFPGHPLLEVSEAKYCFLDDRPKPPDEGFTASPGLISAIPLLIGFFFGEEKRAALLGYLDHQPRTLCPAALLRSSARRLVVTDICDTGRDLAV